MTTWWHILKSTGRYGAEQVQRRWDEERTAGIVTAGYGNMADGPGHDKLGRYALGDRIVVYVPRFGAIAVAEVTSPAPTFEPQASRHDHAHRRPIAWLAAIDDLANAVPAVRVRACGTYLPRTLAMRIAEPGARGLCAVVMDTAARLR